MQIVSDLLSNKALVAAVIAWFVAQFLKVIIVLITEKKWDLRRLIGSGGMPSSHSAFVTALTTVVAFDCGISSATFAVCAVLAFVVMYDATGVRRETGRQAILLNDILDLVENLGQDAPEMTNKRLKELIGHTPFEVFTGAALGIFIGIIMHFFC